ncbi:MAG: hypothetical protein M3N98_03415 [Actinomycetota bacterium]|nr:hypothetical protein [Actinomycetota bacterium]
MAVAGLAAALAGCGHSTAGVGRLTVDGQSQITPVGGRAQPATTGQVLKAGDQVHVTSGSAVIRLSPNGLLELRAGTVLTVDKVLQLADGDVLIQPDSHGLSISAGTSTLAVPSGVAQLSRASGGLTAKVYKATSTLNISGNPPIVITAPRQAALTISSLLPISATPLSYSDTDSWDRRYLATVESFGRQLGAAATGFDAQLTPGQGHEASFFEQLVPALTQRSDFRPAFQVIQNMQPLGPSAPSSPGDYLVASVIALHGTRAALADRMHDALVFRAQMADWGLVAYDQGVTDLPGVLNDVLAAIGRAKLSFGNTAPPVAVTTPTTVASARTGVSQPTTPKISPSSTVAAARGSTTPHQQGTPSTTPLLLPVPKVQINTPLDQILNPLLNPLIDALNAILGGRH